jgi:hypothetical protein
MLDPLGYICKQGAMVDDWRKSWAAAGSDAVVPFGFVQLSCWPTNNPANPLSIFRYAQSVLAQGARVGMGVANDICDPSGAFHPIHPPWKAELMRRLWLWADAEVYGNASSPKTAPMPQKAVWDFWDESWGDWHYGTGAGSYVCAGGSGFTCGGLRVTFDRPVSLRDFYQPTQGHAVKRMYGFSQGAASGFSLLKAPGTPEQWEQAVAISGISADGLTVQLNLTYIGPGEPLGSTLQYGWGDYPSAMPLEDAVFQLPVAAFNLTVTAANPRPASGNCTWVADMDGSGGGATVATPTRDLCCAACWADLRCVMSVYVGGECFKKYSPERAPKAGVELCVLQL